MDWTHGAVVSRVTGDCSQAMVVAQIEKLALPRRVDPRIPPELARCGNKAQIPHNLSAQGGIVRRPRVAKPRVEWKSDEVQHYGVGRRLLLGQASIMPFVLTRQQTAVTLRPVRTDVRCPIKMRPFFYIIGWLYGTSTHCAAGRRCTSQITAAKSSEGFRAQTSSSTSFITCFDCASSVKSARLAGARVLARTECEPAVVVFRAM